MGIPVVKSILTTEEAFALSRNSYAETVWAIAADCDTAMQYLQDDYSGNNVVIGETHYGAPTTHAARALKAMAYTFAAIMVPIAVVNAGLSLLSMIPFIGLLFGLVSFAVSIYSLVLHVLAVQAVTGLDTGKSAASVILPWLVIFFFVCCCVVLFMAVMGASMGDVFNQLNQGF